jgi:hypothetical protein
MADAQKPKSSFEEHAITLLVSTPSDLNKAWAEAGEVDDVDVELNKLGFTKPVKERAKAFLTKHFPSRHIFAGLGKLHADFYGAPDQHPTLEAARKIIADLQARDKVKV